MASLSYQRNIYGMLFKEKENISRNDREKGERPKRVKLCHPRRSKEVSEVLESSKNSISISDFKIF